MFLISGFDHDTGVKKEQQPRLEVCTRALGNVFSPVVAFYSLAFWGNLQISTIMLLTFYGWQLEAVGQRGGRLTF